MKYDVTLRLDAAQFVAIYSLLHNVKLGRDNIFEDAITRILISADESGAEEKVNSWLQRVGLQELPQISASFNNYDGLVISISE